MAKRKEENEEPRERPESISTETTGAEKERINQEAIEAEYERLTQQAPVRVVEDPMVKQAQAVSGAPEPQTLGEAIAASEDLTDLQYAMAKLFPSNIDSNATMVARVDPNVFIPLLHLMSTNEIMRSDPSKPIDVNFVYMRNYTRLSIGLDGMGRIDTAELLGAAREERRAQSMLKGGGL